MKRNPARSFLFLFFFYILTGIACVMCLPTLLLPRRFFMGVVHGFVQGVYILERLFLDLDYEVRGREHLPQSGSYIIAAKHQSPYETFKLHILFKDPAIILKKELLSIPLWGQYLKKSDVIAIDRSTPEAAIQSIQDGAKRMSAQGRPIIIFPQGTRVNVDQTAQERPFKVGVARVQEATGLPIIPLALNTGLFWPRSGWLKSSGTVIFKFLEPINPGMERSALMKALEKAIETESQALKEESLKKSPQPAPDKNPTLIPFLAAAFFVLAAFAGYSAWWNEVANRVRTQYPMFLTGLIDPNEAQTPPAISGYPGKMRVSIAKQILKNPQGSVEFQDIKAQGWPFPGMPLEIQTGPLVIKNFKWPDALEFDQMRALLSINGDILTIYESALNKGSFIMALKGDADLSQKPIPKLNLVMNLTDHQSLLQELGVKGIIEPRAALFFNAGLSALANDKGLVEVPIIQKNDTLYAGPLPILPIGAARAISGESAPETANPPAPSP